MRKMSFFLPLSFLILGFVLGAGASSPFDIEFPIPELGNCANKDECKAYCDDLLHKDACVGFAQKHGLATKEEVEKVESLPSTGPGGCKSAQECETHCDDSTHVDECVAFGKEHGLLDDKEIKKADKFVEKTGPGGCKGPEECRLYCEDQGHVEECINFAVREGYMTKEEAEHVKKLSGKTGPGGCKGEDTCRAYCNDPAHIEECLEFAEREGFISHDDAIRAKKFVFKEGPGGCKSENECRQFCEGPANQSLCIDWAVENGFMTKEEAERAKKFAGKTGPVGCKNPEECHTLCEQPGNAEVCFEHAVAEGLISPREAEQARKFIKVVKEGGPGGCRGPAECKLHCDGHQEECFQFAKKQGMIPPERERDFEVGIKIQKKMKESGGPGGCRTDEECRVYCTDAARVEECVAFASTHGGLPDAEARRMLKDFTVRRFEDEHFGPSEEDIKRFEGEAQRRFEEFRQLEVEFRGKGFPSGSEFSSPGSFPGGPPAEGEARPSGRPGGFPGGLPGGAGFSGPGGCTSPAECIKYCTEHREECFSFGPPGVPSVRPPEGGVPPGHAVPRLRQDLIQPIPSVDSSVFPQRPVWQGGSVAMVRIEKNPSGGFDIFIRDADGIEEFLLKPAAGTIYNSASYGGSLGCKSEFKSERLGLSEENFPLDVLVVDCGRPSSRFETKLFPEEFKIPPAVTPPSLEGIGPIPGTQGVFDSLSRPPGANERCPLMPTVDQCPTGYRKTVVYSSPECGAYYTCVLDGAVPSPPPPQTFDPARICTDKGGSWDGTTCKYPSSPPPPPTTEDPAKLCASKGGVWDGVSCKLPEAQHSGEGPVRKGFFASLFDFFF